MLPGKPSSSARLPLTRSHMISPPRSRRFVSARMLSVIIWFLPALNCRGTSRRAMAPPRSTARPGARRRRRVLPRHVRQRAFHPGLFHLSCSIGGGLCAAPGGGFAGEAPDHEVDSNPARARSSASAAHPSSPANPPARATPTPLSASTRSLVITGDAGCPVGVPAEPRDSPSREAKRPRTMVATAADREPDPTAVHTGLAPSQGGPRPCARSPHRHRGAVRQDLSDRRKRIPACRECSARTDPGHLS